MNTENPRVTRPHTTKYTCAENHSQQHMQYSNRLHKSTRVSVAVLTRAHYILHCVYDRTIDQLQIAPIDAIFTIFYMACDYMIEIFWYVNLEKRIEAFFVCFFHTQIPKWCVCSRFPQASNIRAAWNWTVTSSNEVISFKIWPICYVIYLSCI